MKTNIREQSNSQPISRVTFTIDRHAGKIASVVPVVNSDEELTQLEPWIEACLALSDLIRLAKEIKQAA